MLTVVLIEIVNIVNLCQLNDLLEIIINYIALGFVNEFSSNFVEPFRSSEMASLIGVTIPIEKFRDAKVIVSE